MHTFATFDDLESFLVRWNNLGDSQGAYDALGMCILLPSCVENLRISSIESDKEVFLETLSTDQKKFLVNLLTKDVDKKSCREQVREP